MRMATTFEEGSASSDRKEESAGFPSLPASRGVRKDRRASILINETQQLLTGLHEDADRGEALMAELEALLLAAQSAAGRTQDEAGLDGPPTLQFAAVQPIQIDDDSGEVCNDFEDTGPVPQAPASPTPKLMSEKRRSSVVTFDGAALIGPPASGGPLAGPPSAPRALSVNRARGLSVQAAQRSFTDSKSFAALRRNALTDLGSATSGGAGGQYYGHQGGGGGGGGEAAPVPQSPVVISSVALSRRPTSSEATDFVGYAQSRRTSSAATVHSITSNAGNMSHSQVFVGTGLRHSGDGDLDSLGLWGGGGAGAGAGGEGFSTGGVTGQWGGGAAAAGAGRMVAGGGGGGGGRFLKILKGIFHSHNARMALRVSGDGPAAGPASPTHLHPAAAATSTITSAFSSPGIAPVYSGPGSLESALTHGALSSMTMRAPSRGQLMTRGSFTSAASASTDPRRLGPPQRACGIPGPAPPTLMVGRSASVTSASSPHALLPTPPGGLGGRDPSGLASGMLQSAFSGANPLLSPTSSVCLSPVSPSTTLYGMGSPSAADGRLVGASSRRSMTVSTSAAGRTQL